MSPPAVTLAAPQPDEIEVSIFGPGKGEAIAVHLGGGRWMTVDSCVNQRTAEHPVLEYFKQIGVNPARQVDLVVGTHAHDDHTGGISQLFEASEQAFFVTSAAFTAEEFFHTLAADARIERRMRHAVRKEYREVYRLLGERKGRSKPTPMVQAIEQRSVYSRASLWDGGPAVEVKSLSPSDTAILRSRNKLAEGLADLDDRQRLSTGDINEASVVLWIRIGDLALLLGADQTTGPGGCGWQAIDTSHYPDIKASFFKVPHHGSENAHLDATWTNLLTDDVIAALAPFRHGSTNLPKASDVARILSRAKEGYSTARPGKLQLSPESKKTAQLLPSFATNVREIDGVPGHVQARRTYGADGWIVGLASPAHQLSVT